MEGGRALAWASDKYFLELELKPLPFLEVWGRSEHMDRDRSQAASESRYPALFYPSIWGRGRFHPPSGVAIEPSPELCSFTPYTPSSPTCFPYLRLTILMTLTKRLHASTRPMRCSQDAENRQRSSEDHAERPKGCNTSHRRHFRAARGLN